MGVPANRIRVIVDEPPRKGSYVLYWMVGSRRTASNFALDRAVEWCEELRVPLLIFEPLSCRFSWSALRFHQFVLGGMLDNGAACERAGIRYFPYVAPTPVADRGLLEALATHAAVVITDDALVASLPTVLDTACRRLPVRCEAVDSHGLYPFREAGRAFDTAVSFRRFLHKHLPDALTALPNDAPLQRAAKYGWAHLPAGIDQRFRSAPLTFETLGTLPIDSTVGPDPRKGGRTAGLKRIRVFLESGVQKYGQRGDLIDDNHSNLSPYLHFGHVSTHDILAGISTATGWEPPLVWGDAKGARYGWWNLPEAVESFLDEVVTWRELSANAAAWLPRYRDYLSLPEWARRTLADHAADRRPWIHDLEVLETGQTHDRLWNAAQNQLLGEGHIHSYLRMLWGKKILEWTPTPQEALRRMIYLNDAYATDGRDPNSYSGITWVLGRYDHPWASRPVFGKVRYMSSERTAQKFAVAAYLDRYAPEPPE